jgi:glucose/arabinose dehydrogenase
MDMGLSVLLASPSALVWAGAAPQISVPSGFTVSIFADDVEGARSLRLGPSGVVFVSSPRTGKVWALVDRDGDGRAEQRHRIAEGLSAPNGVALHDGALYVAEVGRILRYPAIAQALDRPPAPQVVRADLPRETHHGLRTIGFGPDGKLYLSIGAPCNTCVPERFERDGETLEYGSLSRMDADGSHWETVARGVRNSVGFDFEPGSGRLWFTDNGRDMLGDDVPDCELDRLDRVGAHFGFPHCHAGTVADPEFGPGHPCGEFAPPQLKLGAHVAPLGMRFYTGSQFPPEYRGQILLAKHGSWNRSRKSGYAVDLIRLRDGQAVRDEPFATGFMVDERALGRPVDVLVAADGSLLVSDDLGGKIWRIRYGR